MLEHSIHNPDNVSHEQTEFIIQERFLTFSNDTLA